jgi:outer membrane receptor protein involved in Fe transport
MYQTLQNEVGVLMQRTAAGQSSPFIRGLTGQQILVLIDGIRMNNSTYRIGPNQYFNLVDPGQVDRIEIIRGAGSVMYGSDAIGGVINIVTRGADRNNAFYRRGQAIEYFSTADAGSYTRFNGEGWNGNTGVFAGASYLNVHDLDIGGEGRQPATNYDQYAGDVRIDRVVADNLLMTVALQHFEQRSVPRSDNFAPFVFTPTTVTPATAPTPRDRYFDPQQRDLAYIRFQGTDVGGFIDAFSVTGSYSRNKEGFYDGTIVGGNAGRVDTSEFDVNTGAFTMVFATDLGYAGRLTYGAEYYHDDVDAYRYRTNPNGTIVNPLPPGPQFPNDSYYERAGAFVGWDVPLTSRLSLLTGVRYENANTAGTINADSTNQLTQPTTPFDLAFDNWASSAGIVYELTPNVNLCVNFTEAFRAPNLDDLTSDNVVQQGGTDIPSLNVESEHAYIYDLGVKVDAPRFRGQAFVFWNDLRDAIVRERQGPTATNNTFIRVNNDCYIYGTEIAGEYLLANNWSAYGNFFYTFGEDLVALEPYSRIPPAQSTLGVRYRDWEHRGWIDFYTWIVDNQDRYADSNLTDARFPAFNTPGYTTYNVRLGCALGERNQHLLSLNLENITDKQYRSLGSGVEGTGFNAIFGWQYTR